MDFNFQAIGIIHSCFREKFGIPRQPGLARDARAVLELYPPYGCKEALMGLEGFSHLWIVFVFHQAMQEHAGESGQSPQPGWRATVRPPRLGGNKRIGVFASRSPFRPNPIGLSAVELEEVRVENGVYKLYLRGVDLLDGTPVLDIKPYLDYADAIPAASSGYAAAPPTPSMEVVFSPAADKQCDGFESAGYAGLRQLIRQLLGMDPRPAYHAKGDTDKTQVYGMHLYDFDLRWRVANGVVEVIALDPWQPSQ